MKYEKDLGEIISIYINQLYSNIENLVLWARSEPIGSAIKNR